MRDIVSEVASLLEADGNTVYRDVCVSRNSKVAPIPIVVFNGGRMVVIYCVSIDARFARYRRRNTWLYLDSANELHEIANPNAIAGRQASELGKHIRRELEGGMTTTFARPEYCVVVDKAPNAILDESTQRSINGARNFVKYGFFEDSSDMEAAELSKYYNQEDEFKIHTWLRAHSKVINR